MKLFVALCVEEYAADVARIMKKSGMELFSKIDTTGFKNNSFEDIAGEWFGAGEETFRSVAYFGFANEDRVDEAAVLVKRYNENNELAFPVRVFILPVEKQL